MGAAVVILFFMPWIDRNPIKSWRYRGFLHKFNILFFVVAFIWLGYLGVQAVTPLNAELGLRFTEVYFLFFFVLWFYNKPRSMTTSLIVFAILIGLLFFIDSLRLGGLTDEGKGYVVWGFLIPGVYLFITILGPVFASGLAEEKPVPARVTH